MLSLVSLPSVKVSHKQLMQVGRESGALVEEKVNLDS